MIFPLFALMTVLSPAHADQFSDLARKCAEKNFQHQLSELSHITSFAISSSKADSQNQTDYHAIVDGTLLSDSKSSYPVRATYSVQISKNYDKFTGKEIAESCSNLSLESFINLNTQLTMFGENPSNVVTGKKHSKLSACALDAEMDYFSQKIASDPAIKKHPIESIAISKAFYINTQTVDNDREDGAPLSVTARLNEPTISGDSNDSNPDVAQYPALYYTEIVFKDVQQPAARGKFVISYSKINDYFGRQPSYTCKAGAEISFNYRSKPIVVYGFLNSLFNTNIKMVNDSYHDDGSRTLSSREIDQHRIEGYTSDLNERTYETYFLTQADAIQSIKIIKPVETSSTTLDAVRNFFGIHKLKQEDRVNMNPHGLFHL